MDHRVVKSRAAIDDAFVHILQKKDFFNISVTELAKEAHVDRKTFYAHYTSINDVLAEIEQNMALKYSKLFEDMEHFDTSIFIDEFTDLVFDNLDVYVQVANNSNRSFMFDNGKKVLTDVFINKFSPKDSVSVEDFTDAMKFLATGIMDHLYAWLSTPTLSKPVLTRSNETIKAIVQREVTYFTQATVA